MSWSQIPQLAVTSEQDHLSKTRNPYKIIKPPLFISQKDNKMTFNIVFNIKWKRMKYKALNGSQCASLIVQRCATIVQKKIVLPHF